MQAVVQHRYGPPDVLELREVDKPAVGDDDVLVRVYAASLHPDVWHMVSGRPYVVRLLGAGFFKPKYPIPGTDMAGVVEAVGPRVTRFRPGDAVFGETIVTDRWAHGGAFAEYVSVSQQLLALKPDNVTFEQAASVPTSGYIALMNLRDVSRMQAGKHVLVNGAGGGVGRLALQIVKSHGARVTAVDCTSKLEMLRALGADEVIDYTSDDFTRRGVRYDLIFDVPGNHSFFGCRRALKPDGRYVLIGHEHFGARGKRMLGILPYFFTLMFLSRFMKQLRGPGIPMPSRREAMQVLADLLASGAITPVLDSTYPLSEVREALRHMIEDELRGKVIVTPSAPITMRAATSAARS